MRRQAGVFPRQDSAGVSDELSEQVDVLVVQRVHGEINFRLGPGRAGFHRPSPTRAATRLIDVGLAWHNLFDFAVHGVATKKGVVFFQLKFLRLQLLVARGEVARRRFALLPRFAALKGDEFSGHWLLLFLGGSFFSFLLLLVVYVANRIY